MIIVSACETHGGYGTSRDSLTWDRGSRDSPFTDCCGCDIAHAGTQQRREGFLRSLSSRVARPLFKRQQAAAAYKPYRVSKGRREREQQQLKPSQGVRPHRPIIGLRALSLPSHLPYFNTTRLLIWIIKEYKSEDSSLRNGRWKSDLPQERSYQVIRHVDIYFSTFS